MQAICFIVAVPITAQAFLRDQIASLNTEYDVYLAGNIKGKNDVKGLDIVGWQHIDIERSVSIWKDLKATWQLAIYFRKMKFAAVHSVTPKAGLITALAGWFAGIKTRIHIFTGQVWCTRRGIKRFILKSLDRLIVGLDNHLLVDGEGQRQFLIKEKVLTEENSIVLGHGSICGVNLERFSTDGIARRRVRNELHLSDDRIVFVFMGRLNHDKGMYDLLPAFNRLAGERADVFLLLIGFDEENVASRFEDYCHLKRNENCLYYGPTSEPHILLQAGDVFVLPTYREGFGSSVIEASALGLPVICSNAYGVLDAMIDNVTGLRCNVGDSDSLYQAMKTLSDNKDFRLELGRAGKKRVEEYFDSRLITSLWVEFYHSVL